MDHPFTKEAEKLYTEASTYNANNQGIDHFCLMKLKTMLNIITDLEHSFRITTTFLDGQDDLLAFPVAEVESTETLSVERDDAIRSTIKVGDKEIDLFSDFIDLSKYGATKYAGPVVYMFAEKNEFVENMHISAENSDDEDNMHPDIGRVVINLKQNNTVLILNGVQASKITVSTDDQWYLSRRAENFSNHAVLEQLMYNDMYCMSVSDDPSVPGNYLLKISADDRFTIAENLLAEMESIVSTYRK